MILRLSLCLFADGCLSVAGGDDEFQGNVQYTFTRPDGTQLGTQAQCSWLQDCERSCFIPLLRPSLTVWTDPDGFRSVSLSHEYVWSEITNIFQMLNYIWKVGTSLFQLISWFIGDILYIYSALPAPCLVSAQHFSNQTIDWLDV